MPPSSQCPSSALTSIFLFFFSSCKHFVASVYCLGMLFVSSSSSVFVNIHKITTAYFVGHHSHFHYSQSELTWGCPLSPLTMQVSTQALLIFCSTLSANLPYFQKAITVVVVMKNCGHMHKNIGIFEQTLPPHFQRSLQKRGSVFLEA